MSFIELLLILANVPILLAGILAVLFYKNMSKELRVFSKFLFLSNLIQLPSVILFLFWSNNMPLLHVFTVVGGALLLLFYREIFRPHISIVPINWLLSAYIIFSLINSVLFESIFTFNTNGLTVQAIILSCMSISYFSVGLNKTEKSDAQRKAISWINSGIFIYFSSNLLLYYFGELLMNKILKGGPFREVWMIHSVITVVAYTFYSIGLWKIAKRYR